MNNRLTPRSNLNLLLVAAFIAFILAACTMPGGSPAADPNAFNTMVAQTARVALPAVTAAPSATTLPTLVPTITPTQGPPVLVSASINIPRHSALDLETQAVVGPLADMNRINQNLPDFQYHKKAPIGSDLVFYAENPAYPEAQFFYPVNGTRMAIPSPRPLNSPSYEGCIPAFQGEGVLVPRAENEAFPLDYSVFVSSPGTYHCIVTDRGNLGVFKLTAPGDYVGMAYVIVDYILWDVRLP